MTRKSTTITAAEARTVVRALDEAEARIKATRWTDAFDAVHARTVHDIEDAAAALAVIAQWLAVNVLIDRSAAAGLTPGIAALDLRTLAAHCQRLADAIDQDGGK